MLPAFHRFELFPTQMQKQNQRGKAGLEMADEIKQRYKKHAATTDAAEGRLTALISV